MFIIAEIGLNHNGSVELALRLIDIAQNAGCDAVKFQKRSEGRYPELDKDAYNQIDRRGFEWFASAWDIPSQLFLRRYDLKYNKVASPMLTNMPLLELIAEEKKHTFISTGMSTYDEIDKAVKVFRNCSFELMHCVSSYPMANEEANLRCIRTLGERFNCKVGWSGHEKGLQISLAAVALGASSIERHITLDRAAVGPDHSASLEPQGLVKLVRDIRIIEQALGNGKKQIHESEKPKIRKYR